MTAVLEGRPAGARSRPRPGLLRRLDAHLDDVGEVRAVAVLRILLGPIVVLHLRPFLENLRDGVIWSDRFNEPWCSWYPEPGRMLSAVLLWTAVGAAAAMSLGVLTRLAAAATTLIVAHNLFLSTTHYSHNRAFLLILLVGVTLLPSGRHLSVDAWAARRIGRRRHGADTRTPLWPLWLLRIQVASVYLASAVSKIIDQDWWSGRVLTLRATYERDVALDAGAPVWILDLLGDPDFQWWFSKAAVATELVIGFGLLWRRTRLLAIWVAIPFHVAIQIGASVQVFSWAALAALSIWVTPTLRDRRLVIPARRDRFARLVRRLDWYGRFAIERDDGSCLLLLDRAPSDASTIRRWDTDARLTVLSRLPATAWFALPALAVHRTWTSLRRRLRRRSGPR